MYQESSTNTPNKRRSYFLIILGLLILPLIIFAWRSSTHTPTNEVTGTSQQPEASASPEILSYVEDFPKDQYRVETLSEDGNTYLKVTAYDSNSRDESMIVRRVFSPDKDQEPVLIETVSANDPDWETIILKSTPRNEDGSLSVPYLLSYQVTPIGDLIFVMGRYADDPDAPATHQATIYIYSPNEPQGVLSEINNFDSVKDTYAFPKISKISQDGRYIAIKNYECWGCGGHMPNTLLVDLKTLQQKDLGTVYFNSWWDNGEYTYKQHILVPCSELDLPPEVLSSMVDNAECGQELDKLPMFSGRM